MKASLALADGTTVSAFAFKALQRMGLSPESMTVGDVAKLTPTRILQAKGNGRKAWLALRFLVDAHGLALAQSPERPAGAAPEWRGRFRRAIAASALSLDRSLALGDGQRLDMMGHANLPSLIGALASDASRAALLTDVLESRGWSVADVASDVGMEPHGLRRLIEQLGLAARLEEVERRGSRAPTLPRPTAPALHRRAGGSAHSRVTVEFYTDGAAFREGGALSIAAVRAALRDVADKIGTQPRGDITDDAGGLIGYWRITE